MQSTILPCPTMSWLPIASDFRGDLRAALTIAKSADCLEKLTSIAGYQLGFLETIQLDRAFARLGLREAPGFTSIRLAILASSTVEHLAPAIRVAGLRRRLLIEVQCGAYGQYRQDLLDPGSSVYQFAPHVILCSLTAREAIAAVSLTATSVQVENEITKFVDELRYLWQKAREISDGVIIQQTFVDVTDPLFGSLDRVIPGAPARVIARLNDRLCEACTEDGVLLLDIARASQRDGINAWFDPGRWFHGKLEIAPQAAPQFGELLVRIVSAQRGMSKKCLVLDLDNTLWGGVIGDDGLDGIALGQGSAIGEAHLALQRYAKQLKDRGVILAVCSKNDPGIADAAFDHPEMILRRPDIAAFLANWNDKAENLKAIATRLNIGLDSLVFVDDNGVERERIRHSLPMISVPELPADPAQYVRCIADAGYFEAVAFTTEDRDRARQYAENAERDALFESAQSIDEFLCGLKMSVVYGPFTAVDHSRIVQLINKTNQFNTTTRRYTSEEIASITKMPDSLTLQFRLVDRIGDNGLVSAMILRPTGDGDDMLEIENWVMSCRVFGRQLEHEAMNIVVEAARGRGVRALIADYIATSKNNVISTLYPDLGFHPVIPAPLCPGVTRWFLNLGDYVMHKNHIARAGAPR